MQLRDYQRRAVDGLRVRLDERPILVAPTGAGKTIMATTLVAELRARALWLAHRRELIGQAHRRLVATGLACGQIMSGKTEDRDAQVQVASIQTLARRAMPAADIVIMDECHHARAATYRRVLEHYDCPVVGLTATPFRLDGKGLGDLFGTLVVAAYPDELCSSGTLIEPIVYAPDTPSMSGVRKKMGDYVTGGAAAVMGRPKIIGNIVKTWRQHGRGKRTVCFATNVEHSRKIVQAFTDDGVRAEHLDGSTTINDRDGILGRLAAGETEVVSNCMVLTEGWDLPALEVAIIARPTASLCMHLQMIGRIMRAAPGKEGCMVLDHAGNHLRLGLVTQRVDYSLDDDHKVTAAGAEPGAAPLKSCPLCFVVLPASARVCPDCQHVFAAALPEERDGELREFAPCRGAPFTEKERHWRMLEAKRTAWNYKPGWSWYRFKARFGHNPVFAEIDGERILVDTRHATVEQKRAIWEQLDRQRKERGYKPGFTGVRFKQMFGHWPRWRTSS